MRCRSAAWHARRKIAAAAGCGLAAALAITGLGAGSATAAPAMLGLDVSNHQPSINWGTVRTHGAQFAYIKATEGTGFVNPDFASQYNGSYQAGLIRGAYHFALPNDSGGAAQASYFVAHGGGWSRDGRTLPGALDIEQNPYGRECYGLTHSALVSWITSFDNTYHALTSRSPVIYTDSAFWATCTGNFGGFGADPLWAVGSGTPPGWGFYTFSQYAGSTFPGDQDIFNGSQSQLSKLATGP
jgi:GH25 family lysozyme M1 (1,4-beta-N-acetylmuramidase)